MDMMALRRMVMAQMASGADYISGTFTASGQYYRLSFGKYFSKYMVFIEATDESKTQIINSGVSGNRTYAIIGIYPKLSIGETEENYNYFVWRIKPSDSSRSTTYTTFSGAESYISLNVSPDIASGSANYLYSGLTYNYYIVEIK